MKRLVCWVLIIYCVVGLSVSSFAATGIEYVSYSDAESWVKGMFSPIPDISGGYQISVSVKGMTEQQLTEWVQIMSEHRFSDDYFTAFLMVQPSSFHVLCGKRSQFSFSKTDTAYLFGSVSSFSFSNGNFTKYDTGDFALPVGKSFYIWCPDIANTGVSNVRFLSIAAFGIVDDADEQPPTPPEEEDGVIGWLGDFWETLKDTFLSLFVPREGYFDDWFAELRTAFDAKLGGLGELMDYIKDSMKGLNGAGELEIVLPEGMLFPGSQGKTVSLSSVLQPLFGFLRPVLTAILALFTIIRCYRKLISLANT